MPNFYSPNGNFEIWAEKPDGYFTADEWAELNPTPIIEISLEDLKEAKKAEIANTRYEAEIAGVNGIRTDRESQSLITGAALKASMDSNYSCRWKTEAGFVTLTAAQIIAVADAVRAHVQSCFDHEAELLPLIDASKNEADLQNINWSEVA
jgi:hypothetical protein